MTPEEILKQEYPEEFDKLCKNRVLTSFYKYGPAKINFGQGLVDAIESALMCIAKFQKTGNTEYLLDAANYLRFEFEYPQHPNAHFTATDSGESAGKAGISVNEMKQFREDNNDTN
jgi:hypothetical protein